FAVQLLQLVHGRHDHSIRARGTLDALEQLSAGGYVTIPDARQLDEAYVWLRTVEHRPQLVDEHQTHTLPADDTARTHLAPDLGLLALRRLTEGYNRSSTLARRFRDSPIAAERTCRVLGSSRVLGAALYRQPDFVDALADDASLDTEATRAELVVEALDALDWREDDAAR